MARARKAFLSLFIFSSFIYALIKLYSLSSVLCQLNYRWCSVLSNTKLIDAPIEALRQSF